MAPGKLSAQNQWLLLCGRRDDHGQFTCTIHKEDDVEELTSCKKLIRDSGNFISHLKTHGILGESHIAVQRVLRRSQPALTFAQDMRQAQTEEEKQVAFHCSHFDPMSRCGLPNWDYTYLGMDDAIKLDIGPSDRNKIFAGIHRLSAFYAATMKVQGDSASLWTGLAVYTDIVYMSQTNEEFPVLKSVVESRMKLFVFDATIALLMLIPNAWGAVFDDELKNIAFNTLMKVEDICNQQIAERHYGRMAEELNLYMDVACKVPPSAAPISFDGTLNWWQAQRTVLPNGDVKVLYPRLTKAFRLLAELTPSEASVERVFSTTKRAVSPQQSTMLADIILAQLQVNSLWKFSTDKGRRAAVSIDNKVITIVDTSSTSQLLNPRSVESMLRLYINQRPKPAEETCKKSKVLESEHRTDTKFIECDSCKHWWGRVCAGLTLHGFIEAAASAAWHCPECLVAVQVPASQFTFDPTTASSPIRRSSRF